MLLLIDTEHTGEQTMAETETSIDIELVDLECRVLSMTNLLHRLRRHVEKWQVWQDEGKSKLFTKDVLEEVNQRLSDIDSDIQQVFVDIEQQHIKEFGVANQR